MNADQRLTEVHERLQGILKIVTNIMTPEGRRIVICWRRPDGTHCMVTGELLDEALRKVIDLEEQFEQQ